MQGSRFWMQEDYNIGGMILKFRFGERHGVRTDGFCHEFHELARIVIIKIGGLNHEHARTIGGGAWGCRG